MKADTYKTTGYNTAVTSISVFRASLEGRREPGWQQRQWTSSGRRRDDACVLSGNPLPVVGRRCRLRFRGPFFAPHLWLTAPVALSPGRGSFHDARYVLQSTHFSFTGPCDRTRGRRTRHPSATRRISDSQTWSRKNGTGTRCYVLLSFGAMRHILANF